VSTLRAEPVRLTVRTLGELCITAGLLVLLFVVWQLWWTDIGADRAQSAARTALTHSWSTSPAHAPAPTPGQPAPSAPAPAADPPVPAEPAQAQAFAVVHVPRFGAGWQVTAEQGVTTEDVLDDGVLGHYPGTAMVGGVGNFAMAGHRVTYGHPMKQIAELVPGDPIVVETGDAWYVYRVTGHEVVTPDRVDVIAPVPDAPGQTPTQRMITITACHPQFSAKFRYVVHGVLESWQPRSAGEPAALTGRPTSGPTGAGGGA
jgi:sortase A